MDAEIEAAKKHGDTLGRVVEVVVNGLPVGLGSFTSGEHRARQPNWLPRRWASRRSRASTLEPKHPDTSQQTGARWARRGA